MNRQQRQNAPVIYEILVRGVLDDGWSAWLGGMTVVLQTGGETLLHGPVRDQSALYGLLIKIRDMGLPLLSVNRVAIESPMEDMSND